MYLFDYASPLSSELKRLGYGIPFKPNEQEILLMDIIFNDSYSELQADITILQHWHIEECMVSAIRVYAYYINNTAQFNHNPNNIVGSAFRQSFNTALSFLNRVYQNKPNHYIKVKNKLILRYSEQFISICMDSAKKLAYRVKYNTILNREDLNIEDRPNIDLFR